MLHTLAHSLPALQLQPLQFCRVVFSIKHFNPLTNGTLNLLCRSLVKSVLQKKISQDQTHYFWMSHIPEQIQGYNRGISSRTDAIL